MCLSLTSRRARQAAQAGVLPLWKKLVPRGGKLDDCTVVVAFLEPDGGGGGV